MKRLGRAFGNRRKALLSAAGLLAVALAVLILTSITDATATQVQSQAQPQATASDPKFAAFVYDVVSIKPHKDDPNPREITWAGMQDSPDGVTMRNVDVVHMISAAYGNAYSKVSGAPDWAARATYDVEAKMEPEVADALQKLSPADQKLARRHMMQVFVRDYLKAAVHVETTEVSTYDLVIAKNGPKLKEVTDPATSDSSFAARESQTGIVLEAHGTDIANLMSQSVGRRGPACV